MQLVICLHDAVGLTLIYNEDSFGHPTPRPQVEAGPAFGRLTADSAALLDPGKRDNWLEAFLPENPAGIDFYRHARTELEAHQIENHLHRYPPFALWANADVEYAGAIRFARSADTPTRPVPVHDYPPITDADIAHRLVYENLQSESGPRPKQPVRHGRRASLSGMRGKFALTLTSDGQWRSAPRGNALNTWIAKHENRPDLPGHAGLEAICQRAIALLNVPAATTRARIFDGEQAILSKRDDRFVDNHGIVQARHQEEFCQAAMVRPDDRYRLDATGRVPWQRAYQLLNQHATDPERACALLTRALAATWLAGHSDMHRRNIGFRHSPPDQPHHISLAPLYDVANSFGTRYDDRLALPIGGQPDLHAIRPGNWLRHAEDCDIDPDVTMAIVADTAWAAPDALADAARTARTEDENLHQQHVDERVQRTLRYAQTRAEAFTQQLRKIRTTHETDPQPDVEHMATKWRALRQQHPDGHLEINVIPGNRRLRLAYKPEPDAPDGFIGIAESIRHIATIMHAAGLVAPEDIPELLRSLERQRQPQLGRTLTD